MAHFLEPSAKVRQLPWLVKMVEAGELGDMLKVVEVPDDVKAWYVHTWEDGSEVIHEEHRTFG